MSHRQSWKHRTNQTHEVHEVGNERELNALSNGMPLMPNLVENISKSLLVEAD